jgi:hypothetical protein
MRGVEQGRAPSEGAGAAGLCAARVPLICIKRGHLWCAKGGAVCTVRVGGGCQAGLASCDVGTEATGGPLVRGSLSLNGKCMYERLQWARVGHATVGRAGGKRKRSHLWGRLEACAHAELHWGALKALLVPLTLHMEGG